jgi:hypothetical protein
MNDGFEDSEGSGGGAVTRKVGQDAGVPAEIRNKHFLHKCLTLRYANPLGP